jgi:DNA repair exonuclease SbcCD ATPase subunit
MRIIQLTANNVMRLRAVDITPGPDPVVTIGGDNAQGKSSVLDAILMALGGKGYVPAEPVRRGEEKAEIVVDLGDIVVTRKINADRTTSLKVAKKGERRGMQSPQSLLDLCDFPDPLEFIGLAPKAMAERLRQLSGVDFSELDRERADAYEERTEAGRRAKRLRAQYEAAPTHDDAPDEPLVVKELMAELRRRRDVNAKNDDWEAEEGDAFQAVESCQMAIDDLEQALNAKRAELHDLQETVNVLSERNAKMSYEDLTEIENQIAGAEAENAKLADNRRAAQLGDDAERADRRYAKLDATIAEIDAEKARLLAESKLPVKGLSFTGDGVTFRGTPFDQASQAEQIKVAVALGVVQSPEIRVQVVRNGSLLDAKSMAMLGRMAEKYDAQVFVERVGDADPDAIIIEDGMVRDG